MAEYGYKPDENDKNRLVNLFTGSLSMKEAELMQLKAEMRIECSPLRLKNIIDKMREIERSINR